MPYRYNDLVIVADPNFTDLAPSYGSLSNALPKADRDFLWRVLTSQLAVNRILGVVLAAPSRPPVAAVEQLVRVHLGDAAFADESKKLIGRLVRQIVEHLGGRWVRRGVPITVPSRFSKGSIYSF